jgi:hypothetical protein
VKLIEAIGRMELDGPDLDDGEVIADVVILCRLMKADEQHSAHAIYTSEHTDAIVQFGMVQAASVKLAASFAADGES